MNDRELSHRLIAALTKVPWNVSVLSMGWMIMSFNPSVLQPMGERMQKRSEPSEIASFERLPPVLGLRFRFASSVLISESPNLHRCHVNTGRLQTNRTRAPYAPTPVWDLEQRLSVYSPFSDTLRVSLLSSTSKGGFQIPKVTVPFSVHSGSLPRSVYPSVTSPIPSIPREDHSSSCVQRPRAHSRI